MVLETLARIVKVQLPAYLKRLPLPESVGGFIRLTEWLRLLPFLGVLALLGYLAVRPFLPKKKQQKDSLINLKIQKENPKVVNEINIEDLCLTKAYCRCWRSKTFPVCDGSHNKHNELTGDNVGPLILKKKEEQIKVYLSGGEKDAHFLLCEYTFRQQISVKSCKLKNLPRSVS
ncbi:hypothetical protein IHE44_0013243 [Lamprotornis superbus]|uniref:CDGSH iron-sulfur domain-containing protein 2 n=1 Tax=Lamprotornis superbus TaxID=245042 RepID=A0A835NIF5_9PASS|nr:hypothetical protein IHE44_0013243 [Lamprotornis superbus]